MSQQLGRGFRTQLAQVGQGSDPLLGRAGSGQVAKLGGPVPTQPALELRGHLTVPGGLRLWAGKQLFDGLRLRNRPGAVIAVVQAIYPAARASPSGAEQHGAVTIHLDVGDVERVAGHERFPGGGERGSLPAQEHGDDAAHGPIANQKRPVVLGRKERVFVEDHPGGRTASDVDHRREGVEVVGRPLGRPASPTELGPGHAVVHPDRTIPRQAHVPFHVAVEREQVAPLVKRHVVLVAEADHFLEPAFSLGSEPPDGASGYFDSSGVASGILKARPEQIAFVAVEHAAGGLGLARNPGVVAQVVIKPSVRAKDDVVWAMFPHSPTMLQNQLHLIGLMIPVVVHQTIHARALGPVAHGVENVSDHA